MPNVVPWIRLYTSWPRNRKTIALRRILGTAEPILGVWCWAAENAPDGDLSNFTGDEIEYQSGWRGESGKALKAMIDVGFIDVIDNNTLLHEWGEGSGAGITNLKKTRDRQREVMRARRANGDVSPETRLRVLERDGYQCRYCGSSEKLEIDHVIPVSKGGTHEESNLKTACRSCNRKKGNREEIEEEEEESKSVNDNDASQLSLTPGPTEPALITFPCAGKVKSWPLTETIRAELSEAFPGVDVMACARKALEWCRSHPKKIKTAPRMRSWLGSVWCAGDQDRGQSQPLFARPAQSNLRTGHTRAEDFKHDQVGEIKL